MKLTAEARAKEQIDQALNSAILNSIAMMAHQFRGERAESDRAAAFIEHWKARHAVALRAYRRAVIATRAKGVPR